MLLVVEEMEEEVEEEGTRWKARARRRWFGSIGIIGTCTGTISGVEVRSINGLVKAGCIKIPGEEEDFKGRKLSANGGDVR